MLSRNDVGHNPTAEDLQLINAYHEAGFKMLPLRPEDKKPRGKGWQLEENRRSLEDVGRALRSGDGLGLQVGECSRWLCAVDLDCEEAQRLAPHFLKETLTSGKEGEPLPSHYVYISEGADYHKIKDTGKNAERGELVCLLASNAGKGRQFAVAPSVHATKGRYIWHGGFNPSRITKLSADELDMHVGRLGAATLIARHLPKGGRHDYAMAVAGLLLRNGEDEDGVLELMRPAWELAGAPSEGFRDLEAIIEDTVEKRDAGEPYIGGGWLNEEYPGLAKKIGDALRWTRIAEETPKDYPRTDMGNAERLVDTFGEHIRYCYPWKAWLLWDGSRWARDERGELYKLAKSVARRIHEDAARTSDTDEQKAINKWAIASQSEQRINSMISLARPEVPIAPEALDADPMLLTVENGTLDLRTGNLRASRPEDLITKLAPVEYHPDAPAPRFEQFLREVLVTDDLIGFVRHYAGYTLTGSTEERCLAILHGAGKNGKSTLVELLRYVMGDYARSTDVETILAKRYQGVGNDVAALKGARFVSTSEIEKGRRLAESKVKQLTGSDTVTARFLFSEPFDFRPEFKLWISTNNKPEIQGTDNAIWDRIRLIPFNVRFEGTNMDPNLPQKLRDEAAGVLAWMVRGCLEWQKDGLGTPAAIMAATDEYRAEMDTFAAFLVEKCVVSPEARVSAEDIYKAYILWCQASGEDAGSKRKLGMTLSERGFRPDQIKEGPKKGNREWVGVGLRSDEPDPDGYPLPDDAPAEDETPDPGVSSSTSRGSSGGGLQHESRIDKPNTASESVPVEEVEDKSKTFLGKIPRVREVVESSSTSSTSSTDHELTDRERVVLNALPADGSVSWLGWAKAGLDGGVHNQEFWKIVKKLEALNLVEKFDEGYQHGYRRVGNTKMDEEQQ
jgi:putative DNA primase/helicase